MLLNGKTAIIFGAVGAIGGPVARAFAREGARVFLSGRNAAPVEAVAMHSMKRLSEHYVAAVAAKAGGRIGYPGW